MYISSDLTCCALGEIGELSDHTTAKDAMLAFCKNIIRYNSFTKETAYYGDAIYIFSGVEAINPKPKKVKNPYKKGTWQYQDFEYDMEDQDGDYNVPIGYASKFARFIRANKLGVVKDGPKRYNEANHPTHLVKAWFWAPDKEALLNWYNKNK